MCFADYDQDLSTANNSPKESPVDESSAYIENPSNTFLEANTFDSEENNQAQETLETSVELNLSWKDFSAPGKCILASLIFALNHDSVQSSFVCGEKSKKWFNSFEKFGQIWFSEKCCMKLTILCRQ